jgi:multidrug efflux system membrane fusion protein
MRMEGTRSGSTGPVDPGRRPAARWRLFAAAPVLALALAGCHGDGPAAMPPRAVLVVHPGPAGDPGGLAFAGEVRAREESALSFRVGGKLARRFVDVGDRVRAGQVLAELDPQDLRLQAGAAQAQLAAAQGELARAAADRARYAKLAQQQLVSRSALDAQDAAYAAASGQAQAARANYDAARNAAGYARLLAPRDGVIALRQAEAGQVVAAGQPIFGLAADGAREIAIALPESRVRDFAVGQPAQVELWNAPGRRLPARIREISPAADAQTRTHAARVALDDARVAKDGLGQSARVFFAAAPGGAKLAVPLAAVQPGPGGVKALWVVEPATRRVRLAPVRLGAYAEDSVPVLSGVSAGDWIVAAGGHLLRAGETVAPVDRDNRPVLAAAPAGGVAAAPARKR